METNITFHSLIFCFPKDTVWVGAGAEIVGYSKEKNLHIVIEDGMCIGKSWCVHIYRPNDPDEHNRHWLSNGGRNFPRKYLSEEHIKYIEDHVNFDSSAETIRLREVINELPYNN